jgi:magnesium transporter
MPQPSRHLRASPNPGAAPGTLEELTDSPSPVIEVFAYGPDNLIERRIDDVADIEPLLGEWPVVWVNVAGLGGPETIERLGRIFKLHPLALEDVTYRHQRAKVEPYDDYIFFVGRMACETRSFETEQVSLFLGKNFVVTFIEDPGDCFDAIRDRLRAASGTLRSAGPAYLAYSLIDSLIDAYFPLIEHYGERLDRLEDRVIVRPARHTISEIHDAKHDLRAVRRAVWPLREAVGALVRDPTELIDAETRVHFRDCHDHVVQIIDLVETYREVCSDLNDLYLSSLSNRMNEVMRVLTVIATIFMPLSFITGVYGMNFHTERSWWNMPELSWKYGYPAALAVMLAVALTMLWLFHRRGWLRSQNGASKPAKREEKRSRLTP